MIFIKFITLSKIGLTFCQILVKIFNIMTGKELKKLIENFKDDEEVKIIVNPINKDDNVFDFEGTLEVFDVNEIVITIDENVPMDDEDKDKLSRDILFGEENYESVNINLDFKNESMNVSYVKEHEHSQTTTVKYFPLKMKEKKKLSCGENDQVKIGLLRKLITLI